jgi:hypothetical protein
VAPLEAVLCNGVHYCRPASEAVGAFTQRVADAQLAGQVAVLLATGVTSGSVR